MKGMLSIILIVALMLSGIAPFVGGMSDELDAVSVTINSPSEGDSVSPYGFTVQWSASSSADAFTLNPSWDDSIDIDDGSARSYHFSSVPQGERSVLLTAHAGGKFDVDSVGFVSEHFVELTSPSNNEVIESPSVTVTWDGSHGSYSIRLNDGSWISKGSSTSHTFPNLPQGDYTVTVRNVQGGSTYTHSRDFTVDIPYIEITDPISEQIKDSSSVETKWSSDTLSSAGVFEHRINGGDVDTYNYDRRQAWHTYPEGVNTIELRSVDPDGAGTSHWDSVEFIVDSIDPSITIHTPEQDEHLDEEDVYVDWSVGDVPSGIDRCRVRINSGSWITVGTDTSYTFEGVSDGEHQIEVEVRDNAGNTNEETVDFTITTKPPEIEITIPSEGSYFNRDWVDVSWDLIYVGSAGISRYEVNGEWSGTSTGHTLEGLEDGELEIEVWALDNVGNTATDYVNVTIDTTDPDVSITSPSDGDYINDAEVQIEWTCTPGASGIDYYEVNGENVGTDTTYLFEAEDEGEQVITVKAVDNAGNSGEHEITITFDFTPPEITILYPEDGEYISETNDVLVEWSGYDSISGISHYEVRLDDGDWIDVGDDTEYNFTSLPDGEYTAYVRAWDVAGNSNTTYVTFETNLGPYIEITSPEQGDMFATDEITVEWTGYDDVVGIDFYQVKIDYGGWISVGLDEEYTFTDVYDGERSIEVRAINNEGDVALDSVDFIVNTDDPNVIITSPVSNEVISVDHVTVNWTVEDADSDIVQYNIRIGAQDWIDVGTNETYTFESLNDGTHVVEVEAIDYFGRDNRDFVSFKIDTTPPEVNITAPSEGSYHSQRNITIEWEGHDETSGIDHYYIRITGQDWIYVDDSTSYTYTNMSANTYIVEVRVFDKAGHYSTASVQFTLDTHPPLFYYLTSPEQPVDDTEVQIEWEAEDPVSGIEYYELRLNDGDWFHFDKTPGRYETYTFTDLEHGEYTAYVRAWDHAGNHNVTSTEFMVDLSDPSVEIIHPVDGGFVAETDVTIEWEGTFDVVEYIITLPDDSEESVGTNTTYDLFDLDAGYHTVSVTAIDHFDRSFVDTTTFLVDVEKPFINITAPTEYYHPVQNVTVEWEGYDNYSGISHFEIRLNDGEWTDVGTNESYTFIDLSSGVYVVDVQAWDYAGNHNLTSTEFMVDIDAPILEITEPDDGSMFDFDEITVKWDGSDDYSGLSHYLIRLNDGNWTDVGMNTQQVYSDLPSGEHTVYLQAIDNLGNTAEENVTFVVDTEDPIINITHPEQDSYLAQTNVSVEWVGYDDYSGIDYYLIRLNNGAWTFPDNETYHVFEGLTEGVYDVDVRAVDNVGNQDQDRVTFTIDLTDPTVNITSPEDDELVDTSDVTVTWTANDNYGIAYSEIRMDEGEWIDVGSNTQYVIEDVEDGEHTIEVRVFDFAGNSDSDIVSIMVDATPPVVYITSPEEGAYLPGSSVNVVWEGYDNVSGIDYFEVRVNQDSWNNVGTSTSHTFYGLGDGEHTAEVKAVDMAGHETIDAVNFTIDSVPPSVEITSPSDGDYVSDYPVTVEWDGSDDYSGLDGYEIRIDDGNWTSVGMNTTHDFYLEDGVYTVDVRATDNAGNTASDTVSFTVDTTAPNITIITPDEGDMLNESDILLEWNVSSGSPISEQMVRLNDGDWIGVGTNYSYLFEDVEEGNVTLSVLVIDDAGNSNTESVTILVDMTPPEVTITYPENNHETKDSEITVTWNASDDHSGISHFEVRHDDGDWIYVGDDTNYTFTELDEGLHRFYVRAFDGAGNIGDDNVHVYVDQTPPTIEITSPGEGEILSDSDVLFTWSSVDFNSGIDYFVLEFDDLTRTFDADENSWTHHGTDDGHYTVVITVYDNVGNMNYTSVDFIVDTTPPELEITSPDDGTMIGEENLSVEWVAHDNTTSVDYYEVRVDDEDWIYVGENTSYEFTDLQHGDRDIQVRAFDEAGNYAIDSVVISVNILPPELEITHPYDSQLIDTEYVNVTWDAYDEYGISHYRVRLNQGSWITTYNQYYNFTVDSGDYTVYVAAYDEMNNVAMESLDFYVDVDAPVVEITSPDDGETIENDAVTIEWTGYDEHSGVDHYLISINYGTWINVGNDTQYEYDPSNIGVHNIRVRAVDHAGNYDSDSVEFIYEDTIPPVVNITSPEEGSIQDDEVTITWDYFDNETFVVESATRIQLNSLGWFEPDYYDSHTYTGLDDGQHTVRVRVEDEAGNQRIAYVNFTVDTSAPEIDILSPTDGEWFNHVNVTVEFEVVDAAIESVELRLNEGGWIDVTGLNNYTLTNLNEGHYIVEIVAEDVLGRSVNETVTFNIDLTKPGVVIIAPDDGFVTNDGSVYVEWNSTDEISGVEYSEVRFGDEDWIGVGSESSYLFEDVEEGAHTISVRTVDNAGNYNVTSIQIIVDHTEPEVSITPVDEYVGDDTVSLSWSGDGQLSGISHYEVRLNDGEWINVGDDTSYDFSDLVTGEYVFYVRAIDNAGNYETDSITVSVDLTPPTVEITTPSDGDWFLDGTVDVEWTAEDDESGYSHSRIRIDEGSWIEMNNTHHVFEGLEDGEYVITVEVYDMVGNSASESISVFVHYSTPELEAEPRNDVVTSTEVGIRLSSHTSMSEVSEIRMDLNSDFSGYDSWVEYESTVYFELPDVEGEYTIYIQGRTPQGKLTTIDSVTVIYDDTPPTGTVVPEVYMSPETDFVLQMNATDNIGEVTQMKVANSMDEMVEIDWIPFESIYVHTVPEVHGPHEIYVRFRNDNGLVSETFSCEVYLNIVGPEITSINMTAEITDAANLTQEITWEYDEAGDISHFDVYLGTLNPGFVLVESNITEPSVMVTFEDNTTSILRIVAVDEFGNENISDTEIVVNVNWPPIIERFGIPEESIVGEQDFYISATDPNGEDLVIRWFVNGEEAATGSSFGPTFTGEGTYNVRVEVDDGTHVVVREQNVVVSEEDGFPWWILLLVVGVGAAVTGVSFYFWRDKKKAYERAHIGHLDDEDTEKRERIAEVYWNLKDTTLREAYEELGMNISKSEFEAQTALLVGSELEFVPREDGADRYVWVGPPPAFVDDIVECPDCGAAVSESEGMCMNCGEPIGYDETDEDVEKTEGKLMDCQVCGAIIEEDTIECLECGTLLDKDDDDEDELIEDIEDVYVCPECHEEIDLDDEVCENCGVELDSIQKVDEDESDEDEPADEDEPKIRMFCPKCDDEIQPDTSECGGCGKSFRSGEEDDEVKVEGINGHSTMSYMVASRMATEDPEDNSTVDDLAEALNSGADSKGEENDEIDESEQPDEPEEPELEDFDEFMGTVADRGVDELLFLDELDHPFVPHIVNDLNRQNILTVEDLLNTNKDYLLNNVGLRKDEIASIKKTLEKNMKIAKILD